MIRPTLAAIGLSLQLSAFAQIEIDTTTLLREEFLAAWQSALDGDVDATDDSDALRRYVLYPYLEATRLARQLEGADTGLAIADEAIPGFLARHQGEPVTINLRNAWLGHLADTQRWETLLTHYDEDWADTGLRCRYLHARIETSDLEGLAPLILEEWLTPFQLPAICEPVFQWLRDIGLLDDEQTIARVRLLLENGQAAFARIIARNLPQQTASPLLAWADLIEAPRQAIQTYIEAGTDFVDSEMLLDGWTRLSRDDPGAAVEIYPEFASALERNGERASAYTRALALGLSWDRREEALEFFTRIDGADVDNYVLEWWTRAALWAGETELAAALIGRMSIELRSTPQWRYWAARTGERRNERNALYQSILPRDNYFSAVAAAHLNDAPVTHPQTHPVDSTIVADLQRNDSIIRASELRIVGLPVSSNREWRNAWSSMTHQEKLQAVHLAMQLAWYDLGVATATELGIFFDYALLYPRPFRSEVEAAAEEFDLDESLIYAVIRQESLYRIDAESSAGALGLMQIRRISAEDIAAELAMPAPDREGLLLPDVNIRFGAARLRSMLDRYDGELQLALAAYNAGPAAADRWLPRERLDADIWLENIPYNETREYVRRVLWHTVVFESLDNQAVDAEGWLGHIRPR